MKALGIILAGGNSSRMQNLSEKRAISAMSVACSYRCIDFVLSNMTNSNIQTVAVLSQYNARSLNEHLNSSKWWNFGRKQGGLSSLHRPSPQTTLGGIAARQMLCGRILISSRNAMSHM